MLFGVVLFGGFFLCLGFFNIFFGVLFLFCFLGGSFFLYVILALAKIQIHQHG